MAIGDPDYDPNDPLSVVQGMQQRQTVGQALKKRKLPGTASFLPAANIPTNPSNTAFSRNAPINTIQQNLNQIPIGAFGLGALSQAGYSRSPQVNIGNFLNQGNTQQPAVNPVSRLPFVSGGYQFPAGSQLPQGFQEDNSGGLTRRTSPVEQPRFSSQPFVEGGYTFPAGSQLPQGFQENGGGGLTRQSSGPDPFGYIQSAFIQNKGNMPDWTPDQWRQATGGQQSGPPNYSHYRIGTGGVSGGNDQMFKLGWATPSQPFGTGGY